MGEQVKYEATVVQHLLATCVALPDIVAPATTVIERKYFEMNEDLFYFFISLENKRDLPFDK